MGEPDTSEIVLQLRDDAFACFTSATPGDRQYIGELLVRAADEIEHLRRYASETLMFSEDSALYAVQFVLRDKAPRYSSNKSVEVVAPSLLVAVNAVLQQYPTADIVSVNKRSKTQTIIVAASTSTSPLGEVRRG